MMNSGARRYRTVESVAGRFDELVARMRHSGRILLPGERELCVLLECSRNTARKLLERKLAEGAIIRKARGRSLSLKSVTGRDILGRAAFLAVGNAMIGNPAWDKLWHRFQIKAEASGIVPELVLAPYRDDQVVNWASLTEGLPEVLIVTTMGRDIRSKFLDLSDRMVITVEEHYRDEIPRVVAMDNFAAGELAAKRLAERGYRKPAFIYQRLMAEGRFYEPYRKRLEGFRRGCRNYGMAFDVAAELIVHGDTPARRKMETAKQATNAVKGGFDAVFLHTDVDADFLMEGLRDAGTRAPRDIGVITVNSFDLAESYQPRISSVAHGTEAVADALVAGARRFFETGDDDIGEVLIRPGIHVGETLR